MFNHHINFRKTKDQTTGFERKRKVKYGSSFILVISFVTSCQDLGSWYLVIQLLHTNVTLHQLISPLMDMQALNDNLATLTETAEINANGT